MVVDTYSPPHGVDESLTLAPGSLWRWALVLKRGPATRLAFVRRGGGVSRVLTASTAPPWSEEAARARGTIHVLARPVPAQMWPVHPLVHRLILPSFAVLARVCLRFAWRSNLVLTA